MIVLAALSLVAFMVGAVGLFAVVVAELAVERRRPSDHRATVERLDHHLGRLRPMPYDWKREGL